MGGTTGRKPGGSGGQRGQAGRSGRGGRQERRPSRGNTGDDRAPVRPVVAGKRAVLEATRAGRAREILIAESAQETPGLREVLAAAAEADVRVRHVPAESLDELAEAHRGVVATVDMPKELSERELAAFPFAEDALVVVLDGVTDPQNLGAAARAADAAGAALLVTRTKRAAGITPAAVRASAGALMSLPHARVANIAKSLERLQEAGFLVVGLDGDAAEEIYGTACPDGRIAVVIGAEGTGMARLTRETCDLLVALPMRGQVASLNAAAALAAVLYGYVLPGRPTPIGEPMATSGDPD